MLPGPGGVGRRWRVLRPWRSPRYEPEAPGPDRPSPLCHPGKPCRRRIPLRRNLPLCRSNLHLHAAGAVKSFHAHCWKYISCHWSLFQLGKKATHAPWVLCLLPFRIPTTGWAQPAFLHAPGPHARAWAPVTCRPAPFRCDRRRSRECHRLVCRKASSGVRLLRRLHLWEAFLRDSVRLRAHGWSWGRRRPARSRLT